MEQNNNPVLPLDFGLFYFAAQEECLQKNKYELLLEGAKIADQQGLSAVWVPERHFHSFGEQFPNPCIAAAAVAAITENVKIRSGSVVLPLHDPIRVVEDWSMIDHISNGRIELSIASGWNPNDFVLAPQHYGARREIMQQKLQEVKSLWSGNKVVRRNGKQEEVTLSVYPKPKQTNLPIWITSGGSVSTFEYAGSIGAGILTMVGKIRKEDLKIKIDAYYESLKKHGYDPKQGKVALMLYTFIDEDIEYVKRTVMNPLKNYLRHSIDLEKDKNTRGKHTKEDIDLLVELAFEKLFEEDGLFGNVETCFEKAQAYAQLGVTEIACLIDFGVAPQTTLDSLSGIAKLKAFTKQKYTKYLAKHKQAITPKENLIKASQIFEANLNLFA